jgi:hypothetical protein
MLKTERVVRNNRAMQRSDLWFLVSRDPLPTEYPDGLLAHEAPGRGLVIGMETLYRLFRLRIWIAKDGQP